MLYTKFILLYRSRNYSGGKHLVTVLPPELVLTINRERIHYDVNLDFDNKAVCLLVFNVEEATVPMPLYELPGLFYELLTKDALKCPFLVLKVSIVVPVFFFMISTMRMTLSFDTYSISCSFVLSSATVIDLCTRLICDM